MQNIFISTLPTLLESWAMAFPKSIVAMTVPDMAAYKGETIIFWLHVKEDRPQWLANTIALVISRYQGAKIVILADTPNQAESFQALSLGAMGYCHAYSAPAVLKEIKAVISHGGLWLGQALLQRLIEASTQLIGNQPEYVDGLLAQLTKRERQVAIEAAKGLSNKEIARILDISDRTVKAHLAATFKILGAKDRLQLALMLNANYKL